MTTLSPRQLTGRYAWRPIRDPEVCGHGHGIYLPAGDVDHVARYCRYCGRPFADPEPRCTALIADGSRRCWAPGRHDGLCRAHREQPRLGPDDGETLA